MMRHIFVCEEPAPSDLALVFRSSAEDDLQGRTRRAVALYRAGFMPKLLMSGGSAPPGAQPEAKRMANLTRQLGVPNSDIVVEDRSIKTFQNVEFSLSLLQNEELLTELTRVILVSSEWDMRRVFLTAKKYFPAVVKFVCCPTLEGCNHENWTRDEACRKVVISEARLLDRLLVAKMF